jgi:hypothetical protein
LDQIQERNLPQFFPAAEPAWRYAELSSADNRAVELDAGRRALYAQPGQKLHAAGGGSRGSFKRRAQESQNQGLRQSINFNYNWSGSASDNVNIFPQLGGKSSSNANSVQAGYTVGYHKVTSIFNANWNRSTSQTTNYFTNGSDIANELGPLRATDTGCSRP